MTAQERAELDRLLITDDSFYGWLRTHFPTWEWDQPHHRAIRRQLQRISDGEINKLMLFVPPRHGKSEMVTVRYSAYCMERNPETRVIVAAYNQTMADKFSRKIRKIARERIQLNTERTAVDDWETLAGGGLRAAGVGGGVTGMGGNLIVIDDPIKSREEADSATYRDRVWDWYTDDLYTRREPGASMILIMTRWHLDDLAGRILDSEDGPNWEVIHIPALAMEDDPLGRQVGEALWPERVPAHEIETLKAFNPRGFWALYQGMPQPEGGAVFLRDWWDGKNRYDPRAPYRPVARVMFWDTAEEASDSSAYTVAVVGELDPDYRLRIVDVERRRVTFPDLVGLMERTAARHNVDQILRVVDVEYASSGRQAYQTIMAQSPEWLRRIMRRYTPRASKELRAQAAAAWCQNGMVLLPYPDESVPWLHDFERELYDFPTGTYKDQVDAFSGLVNRLKRELTMGYRQRSRPAKESELAHAAD